MKELSEIIIDKIRKEGPISFHDYMEMCLYHPRSGYYTSGDEKIGKNGDFYTTSNVSAVFGATIGKQLEEMRENTGKENFTIVEYGAGTGMLCHDILNYLEKNPGIYKKLTYFIIEKSSLMRQKQKGHLNGKVKWIDSIADITPVTGCILSNEVVDNFAVHKVMMKDKLMEVFVDYNDDFVEVLQPAGKELINYFEELDIILPKEFTTEVNLESIQWIREIADGLEKGYVMTIDYGYRSRDLYDSKRNNGTLLCYHNHTVNGQFYRNIGKQDITSHVNFSALTHWGSKRGLETCGFISQASFLLSHGWEDDLKHILFQTDGSYLNLKQYAFLKYTMLMDMGQKFKILIQSRGVPCSGLKALATNNEVLGYSAM